MAVKEEVSETGEDDVELQAALFAALGHSEDVVPVAEDPFPLEAAEDLSAVLGHSPGEEGAAADAGEGPAEAERPVPAEAVLSSSDSEDDEPMPIQPPPLQAVDPLDLALAGLGVPNLFQEVPSSHWAKAAKRGFKKLSLVHHPDKGGSRAAYDNLCRSWDVVRQHIASTKSRRWQSVAGSIPDALIGNYLDTIGSAPAAASLTHREAGVGVQSAGSLAHALLTSNTRGTCICI